MESLLGTTETFIKEEYPQIKENKKNFDKLCSQYENQKLKVLTESQKKKAQDKKLVEVCFMKIYVINIYFGLDATRT